MDVIRLSENVEKTLDQWARYSRMKGVRVHEVGVFKNPKTPSARFIFLRYGVLNNNIFQESALWFVVTDSGVKFDSRIENFESIREVEESGFERLENYPHNIYLHR